MSISRLSKTKVEGEFWRHASREEFLTAGSASGGRWSPAGAFPVCYLGVPLDSVIVEAHRNLVEPVEGLTPEMVGPRWCGRLWVAAEEILDLREAEAQMALGLSRDVLSGEWAPCQRIGQAAHQLGLHGILAPAATGLGLTLALFERRLQPDERPQLLEAELWPKLPADPRKPRLVKGDLKDDQEHPS